MNTDNFSKGRFLDVYVGEPARFSRRKPLRVRTFYVPQRILAETAQALRAAAPREGYLVWIGKMINEQDAKIRSIFVFTGPATPRSAEASTEDIAQLRNHLFKTGDFVFAQVHSHPGHAFHTPSDNINAFSFKKGFISIVVPNYGDVHMNDLSKCAVYELDGGWRRWNKKEVAQRIILTLE